MVQENNIKPKIIIICGATATGKSDLAIQVAKALNSEVVSADSMYVYKNLNIGTAKPTKEEMQSIAHHMIDVVEPTENFTVSDYKKLAEKKINSIIERGKIPIICGGTGFYINSILYDLSYGNGKDNSQVREKYKALADGYGKEYVYSILKDVDPETAKKLHFNDVKRVIRALEIYENGTKKSDIIDDLTPKYNYFAFSINYERATLYDRINKRVDIMFESGLIDEMQELINSGLNQNHQCMQAIGYKEVFDYFSGLSTQEEVKEKIKLNTRHYAKRQITFFKRLPNLISLDANDENKIKKIIEAIK